MGLSTLCNALIPVRNSRTLSLSPSIRHISLTGAIERGLRKGQRTLDGKQVGIAREGRPSDGYTRTQSENRAQSGRYNGVKTGGSTERVPHALPYTTAASEFIYGTFAVNAAIKAGRRQLYKLYIHGIDDNKDSMGGRATQKRAEAAGVEVVKVSGPQWRHLFDRVAENHPHNGFILEASPVPTLPAVHLQECQDLGEPVSVKLGPAALDDATLAAGFQIASTTASIRPRGRQHRYPVLLFLDRITDLGNLGAILRSAYYFGVNAVVLLDHGTAPLSAVTVKASAGAAEIVPILRIKDETSFIKTSKENGWHFLAAIAPEDTPLVNNRVVIPEHDSAEESLKEKPMVLMLGNEGEGLRPRIARMANSTVSIQNIFGKHGAVDSLNVSVAAGILMHDML